MGVAATLAPKGLKIRPKIWPTRWNFWANRYLKKMFSQI